MPDVFEPDAPEGQEGLGAPPRREGPTGAEGQDRSDTEEEGPRARLAALARAHGVQEVYAFGSRATEVAARLRGEAPANVASPGSDLDVGVRPRRGARFDVDERVAFTLALEDLFDVPRVDLVVLPEAGAFLALAVVSGELLHYEDATDQAEYELYVLRRAGDLLPFERERRDLILRHGAR